MADERLTGVVVTVNGSYCFVRPDWPGGSGPNVFAHLSSLLVPAPITAFVIGQRLRFSVEETTKGLRASGIEVIG